MGRPMDGGYPAAGVGRRAWYRWAASMALWLLRAVYSEAAASKAVVAVIASGLRRSSSTLNFKIHIMRSLDGFSGRGKIGAGRFGIPKSRQIAFPRFAPRL